MSGARHLVLFAKAPRRGTVKRRLAAGAGDAEALAFYRATLATVVRRLGDDPRWTLTIAATPDGAARDARAWRFGLRRRVAVVGQGVGDLGHRMGRVLRVLPPGPVVIVGSDIPALDRDHVARAFARLERADVVFGPALDGGYWLVGARGAARRADLFRGVRWSSAHALADTRANVPRDRRVALLDELADIDDAAALAAWRAARG
ncbi:MAG: TIGR04282 family arsenosugar biosynthesis glycosyltransferase [Candidatus Eiseniibacteriota bacterium]